MSQSTANRFHPGQWTPLTWFAVLLWTWKPIVLNYPPAVSYSEDPVTGQFSVPTHYKNLSEIPFPVGWPLYYVKPSYLTAPSVAPMMPVGAPLPPPAPSSIHPFALVANVLLVGIAIAALVYFLQKTTYRFALLFLLGVVVAVPLGIGLGRFVAMFGGYSAAHWVVHWYWIAVYFSPVPAALAVRYSIFQRMEWSRFRSMWNRGRRSCGEYENAEDAISVASKLEMLGDWTASIDLYRYAAERWPEHTRYVQNCIDRVTEKQSLAQG
ncbi:hypothetical protein GC176_22765 [bacterium]|nr:hypothetical protein [bacterium]